MFDTVIAALLTIAAIGAGLMAGVYFAFSAFVMKSLDRLEAASSVDAMNAINEVILRSWFMPLFFGTSALFLLLAFMAFFHWNGAHGPLLLLAALTYVGGMFLCTLFFNVPLNNSLAKAGTAASDKIQLWPQYYKNWTRWNHVRTVCSLVACVLCIHLLAHWQ